MEVYERGRYFTVTGHRIGSSSVSDIQEPLNQLAAWLFAEPKTNGDGHTRKMKVPASTTGLGDEELVAKAKAANDGGKFRRLWDGGTADCGGDASRADLSLCIKLAFWTGRDANRIDRLFRQSGLMRDKWDENRGNQTYGERTVACAIEKQTDVYDPSRNAPQKPAEPDLDATDFAPLNPLSPSPVAPKWPAPMAPEAFHGLAGRFVEVVEPASEADPVALLTQFLLAVGNAAGRKRYATVEGDRHHLNEFMVLVGRSAKGRKGTSWGRVRTTLANAQEQWAAERVMGGLSSGEGVIWNVRDPIEKQERISRGKGQAPTYETVQADPGIEDKRLMIVEPEFANVLKQNERQGNTLSALLRQAWDGGTLKSMTKNSPAQATDAHLSIIGHITDEELKRYLTATETANGFGNRFLWILTKRSKCLPDGGTPDAQALEEIERGLAEVLKFAGNTGELPRDDDARALWREVYPKLSGDRHGLAGSLTGRAEAHVLRLSLIYAVLDRSRVVETVHLTAALAVWEYSEASVRCLFGDAIGSPLADEILTLLRASSEGLTRTEIRDMAGKNLPADRIAHALSVLLGLSLARFERLDTGGRPSELWHAVKLQGAGA